MAMAANAMKHLKSGNCSRVILSAGNMHINNWNGDNSKTFPNYSGDPIPGIIDRLDKKLIGEPFIIGLSINSVRMCPEGQAQTRVVDCSIRMEKHPYQDYSFLLPKGFYDGRVHKTYKGHYVPRKAAR